jgi:hypothetical protein
MGLVCPVAYMGHDFSASLKIMDALQSSQVFLRNFATSFGLPFSGMIHDLSGTGEFGKSSPKKLS